MEQVGAAQSRAAGDTGAMQTADPGDRPGDGRRSRGAMVQRLLLTVVVVAAVGLRVYNGSALWLDEALSVNIAALPARDVFGALKVDGSPPLYYLLLHFWIDLVGTDDLRVRWLSSLFSIAALPVGYLLGRRLGGSTVGGLFVVFAAFDPFLVRYATETRMYSLVVLLTLLVLLAALRARDLPSPGRLGGLAVAAGLLSLTHYWALFFPRRALARTRGHVRTRAGRAPEPATADRPVLRRRAVPALGAVLPVPNRAHRYAMGRSARPASAGQHRPGVGGRLAVAGEPAGGPTGVVDGHRISPAPPRSEARTARRPSTRVRARPAGC